MKLEPTNGLGFALSKNDRVKILVNFRRWSFIVSVLGLGMCASVPDRLFWKGMLSEGSR